MAIENKVKGKTEALCMTKKQESDTINLGVALEQANPANVKTLGNIGLISMRTATSLLPPTTSLLEMSAMAHDFSYVYKAGVRHHQTWSSCGAGQC